MFTKCGLFVPELGVAVVWLGNNCPAPDLPRVPRSHCCLADVSTVASTQVAKSVKIFETLRSLQVIREKFLVAGL